MTLEMFVSPELFLTKSARRNIAPGATPASRHGKTECLEFRILLALVLEIGKKLQADATISEDRH